MLNSRRLLAAKKPTLLAAAAGGFAMRFGVILLMALSSAACAPFQQPAAQASASQQAAVPEKSPPVADAAPARFECSDGTVSNSQETCLVNMARARLPPGQTIERTPTHPATAAGDVPTGATR
jgi:hypothetical protein